ncbi:uncharacterized protein LOC111397995 [Olea europaea var. sylvestris]|uniref:uncharacterized protein LOC111397995 n=1 Tax=Olea europaea var. sylvestris TaxID=158386 RepID=UPI000C1CFA0D|nr:uncharacterized protein LOC111397995 [Olea europaea var. sylvestris]
MVNLVAAQKPLLHGLMKMAGIRPHTVEIEPGTVMSIWVPSEVMFNNRKERGELLEGLVVNNKDTTIPNFSQRIHLLWGGNDQIFKLELAQKMKEQLGDKATVEGIEKAGHLVHLERPCVYNSCLNNFLASFHAHANTNQFSF